MSDKKRIALFIPTYNVGKQVGGVLHKIPPDILSQISKIYFVDNISSDDTIEVVKAWAENQAGELCEIYQNKENVFLGGSTKLAFDLALKDEIDYLICMHSDGQASPNDLSQFVEAIKMDQYDFILGSRFVSGSDRSNYSPLRYWFNLFFAYLQQVHLKQKVYDIGAFIGFKMETIKRLPYSSVPYDMGYHPYLILIASQLKSDLKFKEFPIYWGEVETTNVNVWKYGAVHLSRIMKMTLGQYPKSGEYARFESHRIL